MFTPPSKNHCQILISSIKRFVFLSSHDTFLFDNQSKDTIFIWNLLKVTLSWVIMASKTQNWQLNRVSSSKTCWHCVRPMLKSCCRFQFVTGLSVIVEFEWHRHVWHCWIWSGLTVDLGFFHLKWVNELDMNLQTWSGDYTWLHWHCPSTQWHGHNRWTLKHCWMCKTYGRARLTTSQEQGLRVSLNGDLIVILVVIYCQLSWSPFTVNGIITRLWLGADAIRVKLGHNLVYTLHHLKPCC